MGYSLQVTCPEFAEIGVLNEMTVVKGPLTGRMETEVSGSDIEPNINPTAAGKGKFAIITVTRTLLLLTPLDGDTD